MIMSDEAWYLVRNTPGVTGFVGKGNKPTPLAKEEAAQILHQMQAEAPRVKVTFTRGQIVKISKDKHGIVTKQKLTKHWTDWIDYWSVDFDFESKKEIIRVKDEASGEMVERWTGDFIFENEWQSFRTKKDRSLELTSAAREVERSV